MLKIMLVVLVVGIIGISIYCFSLYNKNVILTAIFIADVGWGESSIPEQEAESYYVLASLSYEDNNFKDTETYCVQARDYYMKSIGGYETTKAELKSKEINHPLINLYQDVLEEKINTQYSMYEACEYFEVAARDYAKGDYDSGDMHIGLMGGKIDSHDNSIVEYNRLMAEYLIELENF